MKRFALVLGLGLCLAGCTQETTTSTTPAMSSAKPAATGYFEMNKAGKTYVFGDVATMQMVNAGQQPASMVEKPGFGPAGETVVFESDGKGLEDKLMGEYAKTHKK